ncbi:MAG: EutP/PduV family microcompartment system protein [Bacillota bacterium]|nr:EutP/PduV family microcompartment system protein [Bacillota bacterium]
MTESRKRIMVAGAVGAGKSTLLHTLFVDGPVTKTQSLEYAHNAIDTPGEFTAHPFLKSALFATALEADLVVFIQDATTNYMQFPPGFATGFPKPSIGVVTKIDAENADVERAKSILRDVAVTEREHIQCVSSVTGEGLQELKAFIDDYFVKLENQKK